MNWIECESWDKLPVGTWLVKINKERKPYQVANVFLNDSGNRIIIVGNCFVWDMGDIIAYTSFEPYEE